MVTKIAYVCIRHDNVRKFNWLDHTAIGHNEETAIEIAKKNNEKEPLWAKANPVVRVSKVEITETDCVPMRLE